MIYHAVLHFQWEPCRDCIADPSLSGIISVALEHLKTVRNLFLTFSIVHVKNLFDATMRQEAT